ncbi:coproporphyrinogen III oxidase [Psychromonas sp. MME2]|uniref:coproporphyrinogen III oxidase n=1 Tax=unclassified Psychromonas TaxID=2614957 RepID=UPI00339C069B
MKIAIKSPRAIAAMEMLTALQQLFVKQLHTIECNKKQHSQVIEWLRDNGLHGGGMRVQFIESSAFNRASLNISQVHYDDLSQKSFSSATALSVIIHPHHPLAPSMHMHISWSEFRDGKGSWRIMADLNPAIVDLADKAYFEKILQRVSGDLYQQGRELAQRYFTIPALGCTRGVSHFYLEGFIANDDQQALFPQQFGEAVINGYCHLLKNKLQQVGQPSAEELQAQLNYHTLYFYQVLTLDKGTTTGLLVHDQNDLGVLASLPAAINRTLLSDWVTKTAEPQKQLLTKLLNILEPHETVVITEQVKLAIAAQLRAHYKDHEQTKYLIK